MKTVATILLTVALLSAVPLSLSAAQDLQTELTIRFADGGKIMVTDWIFDYNCGVSNNQFENPLFYKRSHRRAKDLMLAIEKTERGVTYRDEKMIPAKQLKSIKFEYQNDSSMKKIVISLSNNDIIETENLTPPKNVLTKAKYFDGATFLEGKAIVNKKKGEFSKRLYPFFVEPKPKERIVEIEFGSR